MDDPPSTTTIHLLVHGQLTSVSFKSNTHSDQLYRLLRETGGAEEGGGVSLQDKEGNTLRITPRLPANTPENPYILHVYTSDGMLVDEVNMDLVALENRIIELEKQLEGKCGTLPSVVEELKRDVKQFRAKLETTKHLSWLNCYKELPPSCRKLEYRRRSDAKQKLVREQFLQLCEEVISEEVLQALRLSSFDCMQCSDEEILVLLRAMFHDLNLVDAFSLDPFVLSNFLFQVYKNYNEVPFHNFRHCFCVAQMMYAMTWKADLISRLGELQVLILLVSCICHDLDHPGYNNIYQINARTELALRYNDISPLENHHCSIAFRILDLPDSNIFSHFNYEEYKVVREGIIRCILATDMARHNEILAQFREALSQGFDFSNKTHSNLLCMVLIKVADISNEARPMEVAEPWLDRLLQEFFTQSDAEKQEGLPVTPFMDRDKITKPSSQCSFIGFVLLPLFEALCDLLTELQPMILEPVRFALDYYRRLNEAHHKNSTGGEDQPVSPNRQFVRSPSGYSVRKPSIAFSQGGGGGDESDSVSPGFDREGSTEEDEEETVTEVAVSEKALKFKISTEGSSSGRKSYPGSRKGSRERNSAHDTDLFSGSLRGSSQESGMGGERSPGTAGRSGRSFSLVVSGGYGSTYGSNKQQRSVSAGSPEGLREFSIGRPNPPPSLKREETLQTIGEGDGSGKEPPTCKVKLEPATSEESEDSCPVVSNGEATIKKSSPTTLMGRLKRLVHPHSGSGNVNNSSTGRCGMPSSPASLRITSRVEMTPERRASTLPKAARRRSSTSPRNSQTTTSSRQGWRGIFGPLSPRRHETPNVNNNGKKSGLESPRRGAWMQSLVSSFRSSRHKSQDSPPASADAAC